MTESDTTNSIIKALSVHRPRIQLAAAMETGCTVKAKALARHVLEQASRRLETSAIGKGTSGYLLRQVRLTAQAWRAQGVLA